MIRLAPALLLAACGTPASQQPAPTPSPRPWTTPTSATSAEAGSAAEAVEIVRRYHMLIADRDYGAAYLLWEPQAAPEVDSFAGSFSRFDRYVATVGRPGRVEPGAGQRYVTVPVSITGTLLDGTEVNERAEMILHRVAEGIDGATADQKRWRIREVRVAD
jgi:hypothetical protein